MAVDHSQNSSPESREIQTEYCLTEDLVKYKGYRECSAHEKLKWWGDLGSLKAFVFALFGQDGKWSSPGGSAKAFRNTSVTITWYANKRSLLFSGVSGNILRNRIINQLKTKDLEKSKASCSSNKGISTRDVGIQTDISLMNYSDKDGEFSANTCNMLSVDFEGLKIEVKILESRINGEIRVNGDAIDRVRADVAVVQSQLGDLLQHRNCLHNSKDIPNNGEVNLNNNNTLETIAHLDRENNGLSDSVKTLQSELKEYKIDLSKTSKEYQNYRQIQRDVSSTALPGRVDEPEHCSGNNLILGTTLATIESDKASIFIGHSCNDDYPSSDEECTIDYSCIHHYV